MADPFDRKDKIIQSADEVLKEGLKGVDQELAKEILKIYAKFVVGGELVLNAEQLAGVEDALIAAVKKTDYSTVVDKFIPNFDAINDMNKLIQKEVNGIDINKVVNENNNIVNRLNWVTSSLKATPSTKLKVTDIIDGKEVTRIVPVRNSSLDELIQPIANVIRKDVITGVSFESATENILDAISRKELGLEQWADQISRDALSQYDGQIQQEVKETFKLTYSRYRGTIKDTTRPVCYHLLTKKAEPIYSDKELEVILNEYIPNGIPSESTTNKTPTGKRMEKGSGMIPGTNVQNFTVRRGGYRCRHDYIPLKLTKKEIAELNKEND